MHLSSPCDCTGYVPGECLLKFASTRAYFVVTNPNWKHAEIESLRMVAKPAKTMCCVTWHSFSPNPENPTLRSRLKSFCARNLTVEAACIGHIEGNPPNLFQKLCPAFFTLDGFVPSVLHLPFGVCFWTAPEHYVFLLLRGLLPSDFNAIRGFSCPFPLCCVYSRFVSSFRLKQPFGAIPVCDGSCRTGCAFSFDWWSKLEDK